MTEAEILEQIAIYIDRMWLFAQWYVAISLALVTATHVAAERLNLFVLVILVILYSAYSVLVSVSYIWNYNVMGGFYRELFELGANLSEGSKVGLSDPWGRYTHMLFQWIGGAVYFASSAFLIRTYVQEKRK